MRVVRTSGVGCAGDPTCDCREAVGLASGFAQANQFAGMPSDKGAFDASMSTITFQVPAMGVNSPVSTDDSVAMNILSGNPLQPSIIGMDDGSGQLAPAPSFGCGLIATVNKYPIMTIAGLGLLAFMFTKRGR